VAFWNSETLRKRLPDLITGYEEKYVSTGSYELGLGSEAYVTGQKNKQQLGEKDHVIIPPGQFALLITEERVRIPAEAIGFISIKSKFKFWGLINVSGFHVDPGFDGKLIFSVYNAGVQDIVISRQTRAFLLWLSSWDEPGDLYQGKRLGQESIPDEDMMKIRGEIPSPAILQKKIEDLGQKVTTYQSIAGTLIGLGIALIGIAIAILMKILSCEPSQTSGKSSVERESSSPAQMSATMPASQPSPSLNKQPNH
jgi:dCTP deaminase